MPLWHDSLATIVLRETYQITDALQDMKRKTI